MNYVSNIILSFLIGDFAEEKCKGKPNPNPLLRDLIF